MTGRKDIAMMEGPSQRSGYGPRRYFLVVGRASLVFTLGSGITSIMLALCNAGGAFPDPTLAAAFFVVAWSPFVALSLWLILAYYRERLFLDDSAVTQRGVRRTKRLLLDQITEIEWRADDSIVVRTAGDKMKISFAYFTASERLEIVAYFRLAVPKEKQRHWEQMEALVQEAMPGSRTAGTTSKGLAWTFLTVAAMFAAVWWWWGRDRMLLSALGFAALAGWHWCRGAMAARRAAAVRDEGRR